MISGRLCGVRKNAAEYVAFRQTVIVLFFVWLHPPNERMIENSLTRCARCKAPVKDTDAVLDALRVGQEALDKAEALQFSSTFPSIAFAEMLTPFTRPRESNPTYHEAGSHSDLCSACTSVTPTPGASTAQCLITYHSPSCHTDHSRRDLLTRYSKSPSRRAGCISRAATTRIYDAG